MNLLQLESNTDIENYFDALTDKNFTPLITSPTRITGKTKTLIDNIFYNEFSSNIVSGNLTVGISDHMPQFALIPNKIKNRSTSESPTKIRYARKYNKINTNAFCRDLDSINWETTGFDDPSRYGNNFFNVYNQILDVHAPETEVKFSNRKTKQNAKPWITRDILKLVKDKDKTYQRFIKEMNTEIKEQLFYQYKQQRMKLLNWSENLKNYTTMSTFQKIATI